MAQAMIPDYRRDLEIRRYPSYVYVVVPALALMLQAWLPRLMGRYAYMDLPLLITIYFALNRRNPIYGSLLGAALGMAQDGLTGGAIGVHGIAYTVCGFLAASIGIRIVVENVVIRMLSNFVFALIAGAIAMLITRGMLGLGLHWAWTNEVLLAAGNGLIGLVFFPLLDLTQLRE